jgi:ATP-GRASP peptide maturase of grasp-with-spasm system
MIVVLSLGFERSTDEVLDNFLYYNKDFIRINCDSLKENINFFYDLENENSIIKIEDKKLELNKKKIIWYRRLTNRTNIDKYFDNKINYNNIRLFYQFINKEWETFLRLFIKCISYNSFWFDFPNENLDKIEVLIKAKKNGLDIPKTFVSNIVYDDYIDNYITKPLKRTTSFFYSDKVYTVYTLLVKKVKINFLPSLFQSKIEKRYEIRAFYLDGKCYSMAIFSQSDNQTKVDFRNYNYKKPNRNIPYKLPFEIENKLSKLMNELGLKNGSIDLIKGIDNKYYFLEVNPVGQFGMTSHPCNYNLEHKIFEKLVEYEKNF